MKPSPTSLFRFEDATKRSAEVDAWLTSRPAELVPLAEQWFGVMRSCGPDVTEVMHDGHPTACVVDAAFAYVNVFTSHVNVGFFRGAEISDPAGLLEGQGKLMRHVKLRPETDIDEPALTTLIECAYADMLGRVDT